eukprot:1062789-Amphidinium_carterae.1
MMPIWIFCARLTTPCMQSQQTRRSQVMIAKIMNDMNEKDIFPKIQLVQHVCRKVLHYKNHEPHFGTLYMDL